MNNYLVLNLRKTKADDSVHIEKLHQAMMIIRTTTLVPECQMGLRRYVRRQARILIGLVPPSHLEWHSNAIRMQENFKKVSYHVNKLISSQKFREIL
jgi:hypothetical protein